MVLQPAGAQRVGLGGMAGLAQGLVQARGRMRRFSLGDGLAQRGGSGVPALLHHLDFAFERVTDGLFGPLALHVAGDGQRSGRLPRPQVGGDGQLLRAQVAGHSLQGAARAAASTGRVVGGQLRFGQSQVTER